MMETYVGLPHKGPSGNRVYILLLASRPAGKARATSIPGAVCKERATPPAGLRAAARRGAAAGGHLLCCRSSTMHTGIASVAAPRICPPGARAKMHTLFPDGPLTNLGFWQMTNDQWQMKNDKLYGRKEFTNPS